MKKTKPNKRQECFDLFSAYPNASTQLLAKRSGIGISTLYRYRKEWNAMPTATVRYEADELREAMQKNVMTAVIVGFVLGAAFTLLVEMM